MSTVAALFPSLGVPELLVIFGIFVLIFGASKLPQLGKGLGEGIRNFKKSMSSADEGQQLPAERSSSSDTTQPK